MEGTEEKFAFGFSHTSLSTKSFKVQHETGVQITMLYAQFDKLKTAENWKDNQSDFLWTR